MKTKRKIPYPKIGSKGYLLDVPENNEFFARLRATPSLTPTQLIKLSKVYEGTVNASLANHLLRSAIKMIALTWWHSDHDEKLINPAIAEFLREFGTTNVEEVESSGQDVGTTSSPAEDNIPGLPGHTPVEICQFKCTWWTVFFIGTGLLLEDCGHGWRVIGACLTSEDAKRPDGH